MATKQITIKISKKIHNILCRIAREERRRSITKILVQAIEEFDRKRTQDREARNLFINNL